MTLPRTSSFTLKDILKKDEIDDLWASYGVTSPSLFRRILLKRLRRLMPRINRTLGCDHDIEYIARAVEEVFARAVLSTSLPCSSSSTRVPAQ